MKKQFINATVALSSILLLNACGGGGGESSSSSSSSTSTSTTTSSTTKTVTTSSSSSSSTPQKSGSLSIVDSAAIAGLHIKCASKEMTTAQNGTVECKNSPVSAYLGDFKIGEVKSIPYDNSIYTQDLLGITRGATAHPSVTKISMILQSLDDDAQPLNGISLAEDTLSLLSAHLSYSTKISDLSFEDVTYIIEDVITMRAKQKPESKLKAVNYNTAQSNLTTSVAGTPALSYTQRAAGRI